MSLPESQKLKRKVSSNETKSRTDYFSENLFGFEADKYLQEEQNKKLSIKEQTSFKPWRVFLNQIDSYHGKRIVEFLSEQEYISPSENFAENLDEQVFEEQGENENDENNSANILFRKTSYERTQPPQKFEIIGTVKNKEYKIPEDVKVIDQRGEHDTAFIKEIFNCGYIVYDITEDNDEIEKALWVLQEIEQTLKSMERDHPKAFKRSKDVHYFILISTIMTWALTKPLNAEDTELPFTEADYRKRKCHPNYKQHIRCEREVISIRKQINITEKLKTLVLCCGITYGYEESSFEYLFKIGWMNHPYLPVFGNGNNIIPLLHVQDLVSIVLKFLKKWPALHYIVAVEQESPSQKILVQKLSKALTNGKIKIITNAEALLLSNISQRYLDIIKMNIRIDPVYIIERRLKWHYEFPLQENVEAIVEEFKTSRNLLPVKVIVLGPPASGKTRLAKHLSKYYCIHYIHIQQLVLETLQQLTKEIEEIKHVKSELVEQEEESEQQNVGNKKDQANGYKEDDVIRVKYLQQQLDEIQNNLIENDGRLDDDLLNKLLINRLLSKECQNQGYILDGYPKTLNEAKLLFLQNEERKGESVEDEDTQKDYSGFTSRISPDIVISLEATDEFLIDRIINHSEKDIQGTHYTEEHMLRRMKEYRERNSDENTPLQIFDELEIHPLILSVEEDISPDMFHIFHQCIQKLGVPRNYDRSLNVINQVKYLEDTEAHTAQANHEDQKKQHIISSKQAREKKMLDWTSLLQNLKQEEDEQLSILSIPLRQYLMKYVFPTLTQGLIQVAKLRPDDPIDYLAEYLFKENPEGKMFEPDYAYTMNTIFDPIEVLQNNILSSHNSEQKKE